MKTNKKLNALILALIVILFTALPVTADEGMWTFDNLPLKRLKEKYGFEPTNEWLEHIRLSSVRFNDGGSGSFVSPNGLVITNHHVAFGQVQKMSTKENNYVLNGFLAKTRDEEMKCPDLELNVLISMENITDRIHGVVSPKMNDQEKLRAQLAEQARIQKESYESTGLRSDIVELYQGGEYWLYRYKKYTDIRLVFAPEQTIAFYGGDPDNFTYPRYDLDMAIFRVYEDNKPIESKHYLKWNTKGASEEELVFVSGHPGRTERLLTVSQLEYKRDYDYPTILRTLKRRIAVLKKYSETGKEEARQAAEMIFGLENGLKSINGSYEGLLNKNIMEKKISEEKDFRNRVQADKNLKKLYGKSWDQIEKALKKQKEYMKPLWYRNLRASRLAGLAGQIINYVNEIQKPDEARNDGFHDAQLESFKLRLFSPAPIYKNMEEAVLADALQEAYEQLGPEDPFIKIVLNGKSAGDAAKNLIQNSKLDDVNFRKSLVDGGLETVMMSTDPMIQVSLRIIPVNLELKSKVMKDVYLPLNQAEENLGRALFGVYGKEKNPDATFTLRLSYGTVKGYSMNGTIAPYKTTFYGLYDRANSFDFRYPFNLPERYLGGKDKMVLSTPLNFVNTCDIVGGNSGSPVINKNGEFVGLVFDGNIESLIGNFIYEEEKNRCVSVHPAAMIEALRKLYDAGYLADELEGR